MVTTDYNPSPNGNLCPVCNESEATLTCSRCKKRRYCSRECQRKEWKRHKMYCRAPAAADEKVTGLKEMWDQMWTPDWPAPATWDQVLQIAKDPNSGDSVEEAMMTVMQSQFKSRGLKTPAEHEDENWARQRTFDGFHASLVEHLPREPHCLVISFSTLGIMHDDGAEQYNVTVMDNETGMIRFHFSCKGKPTANDCEYALWCAMAHPLQAAWSPSGPEAAWGLMPFLPAAVLLAHRWGADVYDTVRPKLEDALIQPFFETEAQARKSAAAHGTDPMGLNYDGNVYQLEVGESPPD